MDKREYLHNHNSLLHDVANPSRDKVQQYINTSLSAGFHLRRSLPYDMALMLRLRKSTSTPEAYLQNCQSNLEPD